MRTKKLVLICVTVLGFTASLRGQAGEPGYLKVKTNCGRSGLFLDGKYLGPSENYAIVQKYTVPAGTHELVIREPRYKEFKTSVTITPKKTLKLKQQLEPVSPAQPPFGVLRIKTAAKYGPVYINDAYYGHTDEFNAKGQGLLLNPGEYSLRVENQEGGVVHQDKIKLEANKTTVVDLSK